jgi:hypothetical protein
VRIDHLTFSYTTSGSVQTYSLGSLNGKSSPLASRSAWKRYRWKRQRPVLRALECYETSTLLALEKAGYSHYNPFYRARPLAIRRPLTPWSYWHNAMAAATRHKRLVVKKDTICVAGGPDDPKGDRDVKPFHPAFPFQILMGYCRNLLIINMIRGKNICRNAKVLEEAIA